jgi:outer membrane biosynthesis protein TonB
MTDAKDTLDESAMVRLGRRLQEARMAMGYSTGGLAPSLMAARTQLEDIEAGRMGTFYSAHYFLSLFRRYAGFLKFSPQTVEDMVRELKGEEAQAPEAEPASEAEPVPEPAPEPEPAPDPDPAPEPPPPPKAPPKAPPGSSGLGDRLLALLALLAVAAVAWVLISEQGTSPTPVSVSPSPTSAATAADSPAPAAVAAAPEPSAPPAAPTPTAAPLSAPEPTPPTTPAPASTPAESNGTAALVLKFPEKSWIWVRRADDTVSEVGVAAGTTLRFDEMPIYVVLPRPGEIQVTVRGRKAALARNDTERDMGRFTRTMLEQATAR